MRLDRPIGILLLLWPTLWGLWLAADGMPSISILIIFILGVVLTRSAGCVVNDLADRKFDGHVERTRNRPLVTGDVSVRGGIVLFIILCLIAFSLTFFLNTLTIGLAILGALLFAIYPFLKRYTYLPQLFFGFTFAWPIPMAFAAVRGHVPLAIWPLCLAAYLWPIAYDTIYAMVDRKDDLRIGVKSTAILFGSADRLIISALQIMVLAFLVIAGQHFTLGTWYHLALLIAAGLFLYQQYLIKDREPGQCFKAFVNNHWLGMGLFLGILLNYYTR